MFIEIDENYAIRGEAKQYVLCKKTKISKSNPDGWEGFQYYHSLENLIQNLAERLLRTADVRGVAEVLEENKRILSVLSRALSPHYSVTHQEMVE